MRNAILIVAVLLGAATAATAQTPPTRTNGAGDRSNCYIKTGVHNGSRATLDIYENTCGESLTLIELSPQGWTTSSIPARREPNYRRQDSTWRWSICAGGQVNLQTGQCR